MPAVTNDCDHPVQGTDERGERVCKVCGAILVDGGAA